MSAATEAPRALADLSGLHDRDLSEAMRDAHDLGCDAVIVRTERVFCTTSRANTSGARPPDDVIAQARKQSLAAIVDIDSRRVPDDAPVVTQHPSWFRHPDADADPRFDASQRTRGNAFACARGDAGDAFVAWWIDELAAAAEAGVAGVRIAHATHFRPETVRAIVDGVRARAPTFWLSVDTLGATPQQITKLEGVRFDAAYSSLAWWDGVASWFYDEDARLRRIARDVVAVASRDGVSACGPAIALGVEIADALAISPPVAGDPHVSAALRALTARARGVRRVRPLLRNRRDVSVLLVEAFGAGAAVREILVANIASAQVATVATSDILADAGGEVLVIRDGEDAPPFIALDPERVQRFELRTQLPKSIVRAIAVPTRAAAIESRIAIENVTPTVDGGRFPVKRTAGERVTIAADLIVDGHEKIGVAVAWRRADQRTWSRSRLAHTGNDRWTAEVQLDRVGRYEFFVEAWIDEFATLRDELEKKRAAGVLTDVDLADARKFAESVRVRTRGAAASTVRAIIASFDAAASNEARAHALLDATAASAFASTNERPFLAVSPTCPIDVERLAARFSSWYELFPRSLGKNGAHGTFDDVAAHLPTIRAMGFDVLYMPPIHPIGQAHRKGRNNALTAEEGDVGSPYAIGSAEGGHDAVHPDLGGEEAFVRLLAAAKREGLEIALDFAVQASPDHPWLREHPEWFRRRADGTIRYAENPPKKYEDIVNVDFYADAAIPSLWKALRDAVAHWAELGVRLFRVDNPHTKPLPFWEWLIADIRARWPDAIFLAEAFTRPKLMYRLAKLGFSQSYTYFVWREDKAGLTSYLSELNEGVPRECFRPHFFVNTPDINPHVLQQGGRPAHLIRAALATTLSGLWGMYSGFELCEATPLPGREEYLDSEKYELRAWDWNRAGNIIAEISRLNAIRRMNPELQTHLDIVFLNADNEHVLYYAKGSAASGGLVLVAVNLDWRATQAASFEVPLWKFALADDASIDVEDLWTGATFAWHGKRQRVELGLDRPFALWRIRAGAPLAGAQP
jgi:starch synthase (maltosyl-transferring)